MSEEASGEHLGHRILERRLRFGTMDRRLLAVSLGAMAAIALVAAAVATRTLPQGRIGIHFEHVGEASVPVIVGGASIAVMVVAWSYLVAGVLHASAPVRVIGLGVYSVAMIGLTLLGAAAGADLHLDHASALRAAAASGTAALLVLVLWGIAALQWTRDRVGHRDRPHLRHHHHIHRLTFCWALATTIAVFALTWIAAGGVRGFAGAIEVHLTAMEIPLIPVVMLVGSDFAEWGEVAGAHLVDVLLHSRVRRLAPAVTILLAAAVLVDAGRQTWPLVRSVVWAATSGAELAIIAGIVWALGRAIPRPEVSPRGVLVAALVSMLVIGLIVGTGMSWAVGTLLWLVVGAVAFVLGLLRRRWAAGCLIVAAAGVTTMFWLSPVIPQGDMQGFRLVFAAWLLALVAWRWARRRERVLAGAPTHLVAVLAVIQVLSWALQWYAVGGAIGERLSVLAAVLLFAAIAWDILMSGGPVTNVHGLRLPRHSRVLLYTGYAMLCASTIALFSSWESTFPADLGIARDVWPQSSLFLLGLPAALTAFALAMRRRPPLLEPAPAADP